MRAGAGFTKPELFNCCFLSSVLPNRLNNDCKFMPIDKISLKLCHRENIWHQLNALKTPLA